ncbi:hypothetical protein CDAR_446521 [Caerostris darwini]|uniref:Uncharacterized protein n=1 Tax=Caerostris darwini TaxID=1538125 RepID=A0AAV4PLY3_9ARAC|nr:hypothetical protein CDAR_446521 [Caerostris darwini]
MSNLLKFLRHELVNNGRHPLTGYLQRFIYYSSTSLQTRVIGANNQTNQAIDNRLPLPHSQQRTSDHTGQQQHPSRAMSLMQLTNATVDTKWRSIGIPS